MLSPPWLPGMITTSPRPTGVTPVGVTAAGSAANQDRSSGRPAVGSRSTSAPVRAARVNAARTRRSGSSSRSGWSECRATTSFRADRSAAGASGTRWWDGPSAAVCHP
ncbi:hypothetical protein GCM10009660_33770 [Catellatospora bangladeshensis]